MDVSLRRVAYRFAEPVRAGYGTLERREVLELRLRAADGTPGVGEAAPLEPYDGVSLDRAAAELEPWLERLRDAALSEELRPAELEDILPQARAALDVALWDLEARRAGRPVAALLGERPSPVVPVSATVTAIDRAGAAREAERLAGEGFRCLKLKVAVQDDAGRVAAVRAAVGEGVALRLDANGAWTVEQAVAALRALAALDIELCEEPVHGVEALAQVREAVAGAGVRIAMDETAADPAARRSGACDAVALKVSSCGGIGGLLAAAREVRDAGAQAYVGSTYDGPAGIAAALHAAAVLHPLPPCGLATLGLFEEVEDPFPPRDGAIAVPTGPGLGVD
jgi:L-alanine-DL-glutamate epimerase-like enolase superfamily enzyme